MHPFPMSLRAKLRLNLNVNAFHRFRLQVRRRVAAQSADFSQATRRASEAAFCDLYAAAAGRLSLAVCR